MKPEDLIANWARLNLEDLGRAYLTQCDSYAETEGRGAEVNYHLDALGVIEAIGLFRHGAAWEKWMRAHINESWHRHKRVLAIA